MHYQGVYRSLIIVVSIFWQWINLFSLWWRWDHISYLRQKKKEFSSYAHPWLPWQPKLLNQW